MKIQIHNYILNFNPESIITIFGGWEGGNKICIFSTISMRLCCNQNMTYLISSYASCERQPAVPRQKGHRQVSWRQMIYRRTILLQAVQRLRFNKLRRRVNAHVISHIRRARVRRTYMAYDLRSAQGTPAFTGSRDLASLQHIVKYHVLIVR